MKYTKIENEYGLLSIHDYIVILKKFEINDQTQEDRLRRVIGYNFRSLADSLYEIVSEELGHSKGLSNHYNRLIRRSNDIITGR
jgi:hypothetical protein